MGRYKSKIITVEQYKQIITLIKNGYVYHKPNVRTATILQICFNTGASTEEIIKLRPKDLVWEHNFWIFKINDKKYVVPGKIKQLIDLYYENANHKAIDMTSDEYIFGKISNQAVWKTMRQVSEYMGIEEISPYSLKKCAIVRVFEACYSDKLVYEFLQQTDSATINDILTAIDGKDRKNPGNKRA